MNLPLPGYEQTSAAAPAPTPVLEVNGLGVALELGDRLVPIVTDVSLTIGRGEAVALVGESGCGKSITASAILGLPPANTRISGEIRLNGERISGLSPRQRRTYCGRHIGFIFQEPMTALHPTLTVGRQITDTLRHNLGLGRKAAMDRAAGLLDRVGIPRPRDILNGYVHELSGGMRQRVMIALAISCEPSLIIADEPTTALDVTIQAQILDLLDDMRRDMNLAMLFISHDLEVVADFCDRAVVMYAGDVVERGLSRDIIETPHHPYTRGLIDAVPGTEHMPERLTPIPGIVPQIGQWPAGCRFAPRCPRPDETCRNERPALAVDIPDAARCWYPLTKGL
jgi:oligopeptide/dipeptide ABC transporter ATP-binding protein